MRPPNSTVAQQIAHAASTFEQQRTGHLPQSVTVVLGEDTLVITVHGALSPAEKALARSPDGAAELQEYHRQLFASASGPLRAEIERITGVTVREAATEVESATGAVVRVFTSGTTVQVFLLAAPVPPGIWSGSSPATPVDELSRGAESVRQDFLHGKTKGGTDCRDTGGEA
jgi:uncharacterized protein YbcI